MPTQGYGLDTIAPGPTSGDASAANQATANSTLVSIDARLAYLEDALAADAVALTSVDDAAVSTVLLAANADRRGVVVFNDSTADLFVKYGAAASASSFTVKIVGGGYWEMPAPIYVGVVHGIWSADSTGAARITELT